MDWPWGHTASCPCTVCSSLRKIRASWGSLEDYIDRQPLPCTGEALNNLKREVGTAPPEPPTTVASESGKGASSKAPVTTEILGTASQADRAPPAPLPGLRIAPKASSVSSRALSSEASRRGGAGTGERREVKPERKSRSRRRKSQKSKRKDTSRSRRRRRGHSDRRGETVEVKVEPFSDEGSEDQSATREVPASSEPPRGEEVTPETPAERESESHRGEPREERREVSGERSPVPEGRARLEPREPSHPPPSREDRPWRGPIPRAERFRHRRSPHRGLNKGAKKRERQKAYREEHFEDRRR